MGLDRKSADVSPMKDADIRRAFKRKVLRQQRSDPSTLVLDEVGLRHGAARVDILVIDGLLHGFEIKSACDSLQRLTNQMRIYNSVLDRVTIVLSSNHLHDSLQIIPEWWGVITAEQGIRGAIHFSSTRKPRKNPSQDALAVAKLLWRQEALALLEELGEADGVRTKPRRAIYAKLTETGDLKTLRSRVLDQLRFRTNWRSVERQRSSDD